MSVSELDEITPDYKWNEFITLSGAPEFTEINVGQPDFFREFNAMLNDIPVENWKVYLTWHTINKSAEYLSSDFSDSHFEFYGKFLSGKQENQPRWKRVLRFADSALGEAIGQLYVEEYFPKESKERMLKLVANLRYALGERIKELEWMSPETKLEALAKLETINVKIGYPDEWRDYSDLEISSESFFANVLSASEFNFNYNINKIGQPVDPNEWGMTPQTVNAYYSPSRNEIVFPAGILQPPFFYSDADDAVNYGAIGMVIGHEMTHGFDDKGRQYDKFGNLNDWWTAEDTEKFTARSQVLIDQYNKFEVLEGVFANGELSLGENIADLGGLNIALTALKKSWEENPPVEHINGLTPVQRFFLAYAHVWAQNITDTEIVRRTKEDVHSLGKYRVNGPLPHIQAFYDAFGIEENDPMYIKPENRAVIW
jgi:putative endopeptidase